MAQNQSALDHIKKVANENGLNELTDRKLAQKLDDYDKLSYLRQNFHIPKMGTLPEGFLF